ncbi:MAG: hypothetical protein RQ732_07505 [Methylophaga sp.]|nr:hypothetical protein [Methylophaga sp.]
MKHKAILAASIISVFLLSACGDAHNHPAHDMGERADRINQENSPAYDGARQHAEEEDNSIHPAHEMDEVEPVERRGN